MNAEIILITKARHAVELEVWLRWYLNILGFDKVILYDNESPIDVKKICNKFNNVEYNFLNGFVNQSKLYDMRLKLEKFDDDINDKWIAFLDDDEFLYIGEKYNHNIKELIQAVKNKYNCKKVCFPIFNFYSKEFFEKRNGNIPLINTHTYYSENLPRSFTCKLGILRNTIVKCVIDAKYDWKFIKNNGSPCFRNPVIDENIPELAFSERGESIQNAFLQSYKINTDCFVAHYQFRSEEEWNYKCRLGRIKTKSNYLNKPDILDLYRTLYSYIDTFKHCTLIKDTYYNYYHKLQNK